MWLFRSMTRAEYRCVQEWSSWCLMETPKLLHETILYHILLLVQSNQHLTATMRIFHLSSLHGPFVAQELIYLLRSPDHISPFPFTQADLYELPQPALCLIDAGSEMYIWQGWSDLTDDELDLQLYNANLQAGGPRDMRFTAERRCAFRTAVEYCKGKWSKRTFKNHHHHSLHGISRESRFNSGGASVFDRLCWSRTYGVHQSVS